MKKELKIELTELFMAQADKYRCFYGTIKKSKDAEGKTLFFSEIKVNDGFVCSQESDRDRLGHNLDEMCIMVLDKKIHSKAGIFHPIPFNMIDTTSIDYDEFVKVGNICLN